MKNAPQCKSTVTHHETLHHESMQSTSNGYLSNIIDICQLQRCKPLKWRNSRMKKRIYKWLNLAENTVMTMAIAVQFNLKPPNETLTYSI